MPVLEREALSATWSESPHRKASDGIVKVSFVLSFSLAVQVDSAVFAPGTEARSTKTSCLQSRFLQLLRTCSSDGAPKEFVDSSPRSIQGQECWEKVEFTEGVGMAESIVDELKLKGGAGGEGLSEPMYLLIFPPNKSFGRGLLTTLKDKNFCNFPKTQSFSELY